MLGICDFILNGQSLPAFGAAAFQNQAAGKGRHASPKTKGAFSFDFFRLVGSFHKINTTP